MALQTNITTKEGVEVKNAYIIIKHIDGNKNIIKLSVEAYIDKKHADSSGWKSQKFIKIWNFIFTPNLENNQDNFIKQGYKFLKLQEEFKNSMDI